MEKEKTTILIVDDTVDTVELLVKRFQADGYATIAAYDGREGLEKVYAFHPDLIVLDVMMPYVDGFEVCERLKQDETTKYIPILMLTAKSDIPDRVKGLDVGADGYIAKPFDYKEVAARVRSLLTKKRESSQLAEKEKLAALDQMVDEVSHEVRNPLVAIGGFARRLQKDLAEGSKQREYVDIILKNVEALEKMVFHLVDLKGATISFSENVNIPEILDHSLDQFQKKIGDQAVQVEKRYVEHCPLIPGDKQNLDKTFTFLIENAIEAMEESETKRITITTTIQDGFLEVHITDVGRGIAKEKVKNIFDPFFSSKIYGPGLGLTFVHKTVQNHKGYISVSSNEGQGTTFTIRLPMHGLVNRSVDAPA